MAARRLDLFPATAVLLLLLLLSSGGVLGFGREEGDPIPPYRGINCNKYQLFTCLASKGTAIHSDCCEAIRSVLSPHCLCSPETVGRTVIKSLLPIAMTCEVLLDIGEPCGGGVDQRSPPQDPSLPGPGLP